jgi:hypothetical protein
MRLGSLNERAVKLIASLPVGNSHLRIVICMKKVMGED